MGRRYLKCLPGEIGFYHRHHACLETRGGSSCQFKKGGRLVINAIRKEGTDKGYLQNLNYQDHLWMEKEIKSVANLTAKDVEDFLILAANASIRPEVQIFSLEEANKALLELKERHVKGAKVLKIN